MTNPDLNPHTQAVEELEKAIAEGARFAFDTNVIVPADLHKEVK